MTDQPDTSIPSRSKPASPDLATSPSSRASMAGSPTPWQADQFAAILNAGNVEAFDALVAPEYLNHNAFAPPGREGVKAIFGAFLSAFSDFHVTVEDAFQAGDRVVGRYTYTGVHTAPFLDYAPTGRTVTLRSIDIWRVGPDGRFVEHWDELNTLDFFEQIGAAARVLPSAPGTEVRNRDERTAEADAPVPAVAGEALPPLERERLHALVKRFYEPFRTGELAVFSAVLAPEWQNDPPAPYAGGPRAAMEANVAAIRQAFPDLSHVQEAILIDAADPARPSGDVLVAVRSRITGTHGDVWMGVPATGRRVTLRTMDMHRVTRGGQIAQTWHLEDFLTLLRQLDSPGLNAHGGAGGQHA